MKSIHLITGILLVFTACRKNPAQLEEASYSRIKIKVIGSQFYHATLAGAAIGDSLSSAKPLDRFVPSQQDQQLVITTANSQSIIADTTIDLPPAAAPEFVIVEIDAQSRPLFLSAADLSTTAPTSDSLKFNFLNLDTALTKNKTIDLYFYQFAASTYTLKGQLKNIPYKQFSGYVTLPANLTTFFFEIRNSETGQVLLTKEARTGRLNRPGTYQSNNVFSMLFKGNGSNNSYSPTVLIQQRL